MLLAACLTLALCADPPRTAPERTDYAETSTNEEVLAFLDALAAAAPIARVSTLGRTHEDRPIHLLILADPPLSTPDEARARENTLRVLAFANIHSGECDGKEALLMLARGIAAGEDRPLLRN